MEIRTGTVTIAGRLLGVERKTRSANTTWNEVDVASIMADNGEVRTAELLPGFSLKLMESSLTGRVDRYLDIVSSGRDPDVRRMVVSTEGTGARDLFVSYVSEVPVWKSTYRIVLNGKAGGGPLLQGWAIVDNTVGQDWENVQLSLVAGAPQSFVQNLSQPYYASGHLAANISSHADPGRGTTERADHGPQWQPATGRPRGGVRRQRQRGGGNQRGWQRPVRIRRTAGRGLAHGSGG